MYHFTHQLLPLLPHCRMETVRTQLTAVRVLSLALLAFVNNMESWGRGCRITSKNLVLVVFGQAGGSCSVTSPPKLGYPHTSLGYSRHLRSLIAPHTHHGVFLFL